MTHTQRANIAEESEFLCSPSLMKSAKFNCYIVALVEYTSRYWYFNKANNVLNQISIKIASLLTIRGGQ